METNQDDVDTNIRVSIKTRDALLELLKREGKYGNRMDDIVARLVEEHYELAELKAKKE